MTGYDLGEALLDLRIELRILNERVASACGLKTRDLDVLDVIDREGSCTPTRLSSRTGIHAATMTGILSRLARDGWIARGVSPSDGRSVTITATERMGEVRARYDEADEAMARATAEIDPAERAAIVAFLRDVGTIARGVADGLDAAAEPG